VKCAACKHVQRSHKLAEMATGPGLVRLYSMGKCGVRGCKCKAFEVPKSWKGSGASVAQNR
jgi:hypothetical protein